MRRYFDLKSSNFVHGVGNICKFPQLESRLGVVAEEDDGVWGQEGGGVPRYVTARWCLEVVAHISKWSTLRIGL